MHSHFANLKHVRESFLPHFIKISLVLNLRDHIYRILDSLECRGTSLVLINLEPRRLEANYVNFHYSYLACHLDLKDLLNEFPTC